MNELKDIAYIFRDAVEKTKNELSKLSNKFETFPEYCCGITANLLARYYDEKGYGIFLIVTGKKSTGEEHYWLQKEKVIIDITADQFPDCKEEVIVTTDDSWYNNFICERESHNANYRKYDKMYSVIIEYLNDK